MNWLTAPNIDAGPHAVVAHGLGAWLNGLGTMQPARDAPLATPAHLGSAQRA